MMNDTRILAGSGRENLEREENYRERSRIVIGDESFAIDNCDIVGAVTEGKQRMQMFLLIDACKGVFAYALTIDFDLYGLIFRIS